MTVLRGFLGGGAPPLESFRGLPSYEEVRRGSSSSGASTSRSDSNVAGYFAARMSHGSGPGVGVGHGAARTGSQPQSGRTSLSSQ